MANKQMTVQELYDALGFFVEHNAHLPVESEGCDCFGEVGSIELRNGALCLKRVVEPRPQPAKKPPLVKDIGPLL